MVRFGLRSELSLRGRDDKRDWDVELRKRCEERTGDDSREDIVEFVVDVGTEPGTLGASLGIWEVMAACVCGLMVERGTSVMSPSLGDRRDAGKAASSWAPLDPPEVPLV